MLEEADYAESTLDMKRFVVTSVVERTAHKRPTTANRHPNRRQVVINLK